MLERRSLSLLLTLAVAAGIGADAASLRVGFVRGYLVPELDGTPVSIQNPIDGRTWTAWAYRSGREFDLAISVLSGEVWSEPQFIGRWDGSDQIQPAFAVDAAGNLYLAITYLHLGTPSVHLSVLPMGASSWSIPEMVSIAGERASAPSLKVIGDRVVVAYRSGRSTVIRDFPVWQVYEPDGVQDGPDVLPPSAYPDEGDGGGEDDPIPLGGE